MVFSFFITSHTEDGDDVLRPITGGGTTPISYLGLPVTVRVRCTAEVTVYSPGFGRDLWMFQSLLWR